MPDNVPASINQRTLERALQELRAWKQHAIKQYATTDNDEYRARMRALADDLEYVAFRLEQLLHPMGGGQ